MKGKYVYRLYVVKSRGILYSFSLKCHRGLEDGFSRGSVRYTIVVGEKKSISAGPGRDKILPWYVSRDFYYKYIGGPWYFLL